MRDEEIARGGPAVDDPHDVSALSPDDAGRCVPQAPMQPFRFGDREFTGAAQVMEPAHQISRDTDELHPGAVGVEVGERERSSPESFSRLMWSSTCAWSRMCASSSTGSPVLSV